MVLGNDNGMPEIEGRNVQKRKNLVILVDFRARNLAFQYLAEDTIIN